MAQRDRDWLKKNCISCWGKSGSNFDNMSNREIISRYDQIQEDIREELVVYGTPPNVGITGTTGADSPSKSTGRTEPVNLKEQLAMEQVKSNPGAGEVLTDVKMNDPRWPASQGWVKMAQHVNGVEIHYVSNTATGAVADFKFIR